MDSPAFYSIVKNFTSLTEDEYSSIKDLSKEYPYSQIINLLKARAAQDLNHSDKEKELHFAALYSTERTVLKQVMTAPKAARNETLIVAPVTELAEPKPGPIIEKSPVEIKVEEPLQESEIMPPVVREIVTLSDDELIKDIYAELEKLQKLKKEFALTVEAFENGMGTVSLPKNKIEKEPANDPLIEQIKTTKKKLKVENPKQKEQNEIIDKFIKIQPSIPKAKPAESASDLSEDSGMFSDNIVSETLVEILLKQGKKDKAVEVLKKLIWKFPQKKAYFAAQIDSLKN